MYVIPPLYTCLCARSCVLCVKFNRITLVFWFFLFHQVDHMGLDNASGQVASLCCPCRAWKGRLCPVGFGFVVTLGCATTEGVMCGFLSFFGIQVCNKVAL